MYYQNWKRSKQHHRPNPRPKRAKAAITKSIILQALALNLSQKVASKKDIASEILAPYGRVGYLRRLLYRHHSANSALYVAGTLMAIYALAPLAEHYLAGAGAERTNPVTVDSSFLSTSTWTFGALLAICAIPIQSYSARDDATKFVLPYTLKKHFTFWTLGLTAGIALGNTVSHSASLIWQLDSQLVDWLNLSLVPLSLGFILWSIGQVLINLSPTASHLSSAPLTIDIAEYSASKAHIRAMRVKFASITANFSGGVLHRNATHNTGTPQYTFHLSELGWICDVDTSKISELVSKLRDWGYRDFEFLIGPGESTHNVPALAISPHATRNSLTAEPSQVNSTSSMPPLHSRVLQNLLDASFCVSPDLDSEHQQLHELFRSLSDLLCRLVRSERVDQVIPLLEAIGDLLVPWAMSYSLPRANGPYYQCAGYTESIPINFTDAFRDAGKWAKVDGHAALFRFLQRLSILGRRYDCSVLTRSSGKLATLLCSVSTDPDRSNFPSWGTLDLFAFHHLGRAGAVGPALSQDAILDPDWIRAIPTIRRNSVSGVLSLVNISARSNNFVTAVVLLERLEHSLEFLTRTPAKRTQHRLYIAFHNFAIFIGFVRLLDVMSGAGSAPLSAPNFKLLQRASNCLPPTQSLIFCWELLHQEGIFDSVISKELEFANWDAFEPEARAGFIQSVSPFTNRLFEGLVAALALAPSSPNQNDIGDDSMATDQVWPSPISIDESKAYPLINSLPDAYIDKPNLLQRAVECINSRAEIVVRRNAIANYEDIPPQVIDTLLIGVRTTAEKERDPFCLAIQVDATDLYGPSLSTGPALAVRIHLPRSVLTKGAETSSIGAHAASEICKMERTKLISDLLAATPKLDVASGFGLDQFLASITDHSTRPYVLVLPDRGPVTPAILGAPVHALRREQPRELAKRLGVSGIEQVYLGGIDLKSALLISLKGSVRHQHILHDHIGSRSLQIQVSLQDVPSAVRADRQAILLSEDTEFDEGLLDPDIHVSFSALPPTIAMQSPDGYSLNFHSTDWRFAYIPETHLFHRGDCQRLAYGKKVVMLDSLVGLPAEVDWTRCPICQPQIDA